VIWKGQWASTVEADHDKYGPIVRTGPNTVSIADPSCVEKIFNIRNEYPKDSDVNLVWTSYKDGKKVPSFVAESDKRIHSNLRKPVSSVFSMTNVTQSEPYVNDLVIYLLQRLEEEFVIPNKPCPMDEWLAYCKPPLPLSYLKTN
jgi:cytochrome P450